MVMVADIVDAVIGADTHRDTHCLQIAHPNGAVIATATFPTDRAGHEAMLAWIYHHAPGPRLVASIEGTRSYGAGLARAATDAGLRVIEAEQPPRTRRRGRGKSDTIDAHLAIRYALSLDAQALPTPRADGDREALRILLAARHDLVTARTRMINRLRALLITGQHTDHRLAHAPMNPTTLTHIARRRARRNDTREHTIRRAETRRLAHAIQHSDRELAENNTTLANLVNDLAPGLTDKIGIGPISAAQTIVSWSHKGRCRNDSAFAALAGASPLPASSGRITRHRLNRGGDRHLNRALHTIALTRWQHCPRTRAYITKRRAQNTPDTEIRRLLKRYIAREIHRHLTAHPPLDNT